ncbi:sugar-binding protein [Actinomadura yumaensis]|uniref:Sugar-binding protein n=1 Tax=Actinomadura yumaensis TaxID=111807 RepID=A0ABW2CX79_9ACTN
MKRHARGRPRLLALPVAAAVLAGLLAAPPAPPARAAGPPAHAPAGRLDVLFVGAHPDDEAGSLSTLGQWNEDAGAKIGVLTVTRGEGGGNAAGDEEGPPLGLLREDEERRAVAKAGVADVHYLDEVDFFYTVSAPLTARTWDHASTLEKVVRLVRETRPKVIVTMEPAPLPGQHGNHQEAARLATEAYFAAADPRVLPGVRPWAPGRLFATGGASGPDGPACASSFTPADPSAVVYGVWGGRASARNGGRTWAQVEREAQRVYASQGWAGFPDAPSDPGGIGCDYFTQVHSRVPFTLGGRGAGAMLEGAVAPSGGLPSGTEFSLAPRSFGVTAGRAFEVTARVRSPGTLPNARVTLHAPDGWKVGGSGDLGTVRNGARTAAFTVEPPRGAPFGRVRLEGTLRTARGAAQAASPVEVRAAVTGVQEPLERVADFDAWASRTGVPALEDRVKRVLTLGSGQSRRVRIDLAETTGAPQKGTVALDLPDGFAADAPSKPYELKAGGTGSVAFTVTNTDASIPTSNEGGAGGDHDYTITTANGTGPPDRRKAALELVPVAELPKAAEAPETDGVEDPGEYPGRALDLSRVWEGAACGSAADCSATGKATWTDRALHVLVRVRDDARGTVLPAADCKRHWRTDSVEIAIDPRGGSENTSTTFKAGIFPAMADGRPCFERDADHHQGPGPGTAPGMKVASAVTEPYTGYTVEAEIPFTVLPAAVDPARMGLDLFVYDSDTRDKTGQTRIGWSTWGGVQGDPYRWGLATLPGHVPPPGTPPTAPPPVMPTDAAASVDSPLSIVQAAATGIPLAGGPAAPPWATARLAGRPSASGSATTFRLLATGPGTAYAHVWDGRVLGTRKVAFGGPGLRTISVPGAKGVLAVAFEARTGGTASLAARIGR